MTTPDSKKEVRRWQNTRPERTTPPGKRTGRVDDQQIAGLFAKVCVAWPHLEEEMISVFQRLLGSQRGDSETARLVFTSLVNQKIRIDLMRALLERGRLNKDRSGTYDEVISEFEKLNALRNKYVHGRWWTHENGDTYLQPDNSAPFTHAKYQRITAKDLQQFLNRVNGLWQKLLCEV